MDRANFDFTLTLMHF